VQFTPDLLPSDIIGTSVWRADRADFEFRPGPIFTDTLLADEINRAPAKTQAALLEAMEERQVTSDGVSRPLGNRFMVVATQNPVEYEGTYPLPEAQLDRFFFKLGVDTPDQPTEAAMLRRIDAGFDAHDLVAAGIAPVIDVDALAASRAEVASVRVSDEVVGYITAIVAATRTSPDLSLGASPRGAIALLRGAKAMARIQARDYVVPDDVKDICIPALRHRLVRRAEAELQGVSEVSAVERALATVPGPSCAGHGSLCPRRRARGRRLAERARSPRRVSGAQERPAVLGGCGQPRGAGRACSARGVAGAPRRRAAGDARFGAAALSARLRGGGLHADAARTRRRRLRSCARALARAMGAGDA
jgi:MoxR-like ATPase